MTREASHRRSRRGSRPIIGLAIASVVIVTACNPFDRQQTQQIPDNADKILQSVDVTVNPDASITAINSTAVATAPGSSEPITHESSYAPGEVVSDLPVRLVTAYRTDQGRTGSNLNDLAQYSGRVEITVTVQNLTVSPQEITYDSSGLARSRSALVGTPLTVVAATQLVGTSPANVVLDAANGQDTVTNGVLSQTDAGDAIVQWATILAPPRLPASANLHLVLNTEEFAIPTFDITVQPGMVIDTSVANLVDSTFDAATAQDLDLQYRTIQLVGKVNRVLGEAGETISALRTNLDSTSQKLGAKTLTDLQSNAESVRESMKQLGGEVGSLSDSIATRLQTTESGLLDLLEQTVQAIDAMLGDTSSAPASTTTDGAGCATVVTHVGPEPSLYANLSQASAQLGAYAQATEACKGEIQQHLSAMVGPADPTAEACAGSTSLTCSLVGTQTTFDAVAGKLTADTQAALDALAPERMTEAMTSFATVSTDIEAVRAQISGLQTAMAGGGGTDFSSLRAAITTLEEDLGTLTTAIEDVHKQATDAQVAETSMAAQNDDAAAQICDLIEAGKLAADDGDTLRAFLTGTSCPAEGETPLPPPAGYTQPMTERLSGQIEAWDAIISATDTASPTPGSIGALLDALDQDVTAVNEAIWDDDGPSSLKLLIDDLAKAADGIEDSRNDLSTKLTAVQEQQTVLATQVQGAIDSAATSATEAAAGTAADHIGQLSEQGNAGVLTAGSLFDRSATGLAGAAGAISANGMAAVDAQRAAVALSSTQAGAMVTGQAQGDISAIAATASASTRNLDGASALLAKDFEQVLLDLGHREKGTGLLGAMGTSAAKAGTADYQVAQATATTTAYSNVRAVDVDGIHLRQAQTELALKAQYDFPAFQIDPPQGANHRIVYTFHVGGAE